MRRGSSVRMDAGAGARRSNPLRFSQPVAKLTPGLIERLDAAAGDPLIDVVLEVRPRSVAAPTAKALSRTEAIAATKQRFSEAAAPVEQHVTKLGGEILERAWINGSIRARVPVSSVRQLADADGIASIDVPHTLTRE
jgi:hypothetical protein